MLMSELFADAPPVFQAFPKIARLNREIVITEKIDGTNAQVCIDEHNNVRAGSRTRWITPEEDNFGFARWVEENREELLKLGPGQHFGEWWGRGIQRNYGLDERRFSLFNVSRWGDAEVRPACCHVVPVVYRGPFHGVHIENAVLQLREWGSFAAPGFMKPEGIVVYHTAANQMFKVTLEKDEQPKGKN